MPYSGTTYTNVSGATTAAAGQTVQSAVWNNIHGDIASALTQSYSQTVGIVSFKNALFMNGSLDIWQRGAGGAASFNVPQNTTQYTADRWYVTTGANQATTVTINAPFSNASILAGIVQRQFLQTGTTAMIFGYPLELNEVIKLRGSKVSLTGILAAASGFSPTNGTITVNFFVGTGTAQKAGAAAVNFTNPTTVLTASVNVPLTAVGVAVTGQSSAAVPTNATQGELQFTWTPTGTAAATDLFALDDMQLEPVLSSFTWVPSTYERIPFEVCLEFCKRHYVSTFPYGTAPAQAGGIAGSLQVYAISTTQKVASLWAFPTEMRAVPTITTFNPSVASANWQDHTTSVSVVAVIDTSAPGTKGIYITASVTTSLAINDLLYIHAQADAGL